MSDSLTEDEQRVLHNLSHLASVLDGDWPGLRAWNAAVRGEKGESTRDWLRRNTKARRKRK